MFNINKVINQLKVTDPNGFIIESHLQIQFGYALKAAYPKAKNIIFEWAKDHKRVDLIADIDNETIGFEFKYFTKKQKLNLNANMDVDLKDQIACDLLRIGVWKDIEKMEYFVKTKKAFNKGYSILLTNDIRCFNVLNKSNFDYEFDISNGFKTAGRRVRCNKSGKVTHSTTTSNDYSFQNSSYSTYLYQLIVEIK